MLLVDDGSFGQIIKEEPMVSSANRIMLQLVFCFAIFAMAGCTTRLGDFTVLSTKNVDVSGVKQGDRYSGEDCINTVLGIPLGEPNWKNAMDQALQKGKGDILIDTVLTVKGWSLILFGQSCIIIEGNVSRTASYSR